MGFNTDAEKRGGYLVSHEMKKVWAVELDLLRQLIEVCQRENLRMWVDGGTLLGAVRHQGFIPWDDDIDVCMPRPDYDRLTAISGQVFKEPYFYQNAYTDKDYFAGHAQLRNSRTAAIRPSASFNPFNQGIFIDIFVLEYGTQMMDFGVATAAGIFKSVVAIILLVGANLIAKRLGEDTLV